MRKAMLMEAEILERYTGLFCDSALKKRFTRVTSR